MTWTRTRPKIAGWYWHWAKGQEPIVVHIIPEPWQHDPRKLVLSLTREGRPVWERVSQIHGKWAGPLEMPE